VVRDRVLEARRRQFDRQGVLNGELNGRRLRQNCQPASSAGAALLQRAVERFSLSVRGVSRVLRVARTIGDLEGASEVSAAHVAEALHFRLASRPTNRSDGYENGDSGRSM
jgi:magnesium chelatase family protein